MRFLLYSILQNKQYINNPRTEDDVKESILEGGGMGEVFLVSPAKLWHAMNKGFITCDVCLHA